MQRGLTSPTPPLLSPSLLLCAALCAAQCAALCALPGCTGEVVNQQPTEAGPELDLGPAQEGGGPSRLLWKSTQAHLGKIHGLNAKGTTLYVSADTGLYLYVLATELKPRCSAESGGSGTPVPAPAVLDSAGNAYFTRSAQRCLSSIDDSCKPRWDLSGLYYVDCKASTDAAPALFPAEHQVVVTTSADGSGTAHIFGIKTSDGSTAWHEELANHTVIRSLTAGHNGTMYIGATSNGIGKLYTLRAADHAPQMLYQASEFHAPGLLATNGNFIIGDWNYNLHAIKADGSSAWTATLGGRMVSAPAESGGQLLIASSVYGVESLGLGGAETWTYQNAKVHYSGLTTDDTGTIYVGSAGDCSGGAAGGCVFAVKGGNVLWSESTARPVEATPLWHEGKLIVGDEGGTLYAFSTGS